ncbi:hypothetical protein HMPREF3213_00708 [Heyndrickxia coagulans]|uniref:Uncharacterized protein n=1 Tax=Heyndrickxia coagulans TaxID=1398 RepID=A0A133KZU5_HEYCO|nr:hypothetical protein HMPREF3213_00708 [Heyndrickxia coagulans]
MNNRTNWWLPPEEFVSLSFHLIFPSIFACFLMDLFCRGTRKPMQPATRFRTW